MSAHSVAPLLTRLCTSSFARTQHMHRTQRGRGGCAFAFPPAQENTRALRDSRVNVCDHIQQPLGALCLAPLAASIALDERAGAVLQPAKRMAQFLRLSVWQRSGSLPMLLGVVCWVKICWRFPLADARDSDIVNVARDCNITDHIWWNSAGITYFHLVYKVRTRFEVQPNSFVRQNEMHNMAS